MDPQAKLIELLKSVSPEQLAKILSEATKGPSTDKKALGTPGKYVYYFSPSGAEGSASMKNILGGKGANLAEMASIGLPVPPGFTISAEMCDIFFKLGGSYPPEVKDQVAANLQRLEVCNCQFRH